MQRLTVRINHPGFPPFTATREWLRSDLLSFTFTYNNFVCHKHCSVAVNGLKDIQSGCIFSEKLKGVDIFRIFFKVYVLVDVILNQYENIFFYLICILIMTWILNYDDVYTHKDIHSSFLHRTPSSCTTLISCSTSLRVTTAPAAPLIAPLPPSPLFHHPEKTIKVCVIAFEVADVNCFCLISGVVIGHFLFLSLFFSF